MLPGQYATQCKDKMKSTLMNEINDVGSCVTNLFNCIYHSPSYHSKYDCDVSIEERSQFYFAFKKIFDLGADVHNNLKDLQDIYVNVIDTFFNTLAKSSGSHEGWWICVSPLEMLQTTYFCRVGIAETWKEKALEVAVRVHKLRMSFLCANKRML